jgi:putative transposase
VFKDRSLPKGATITNGSFNKRSDGHWYVRITYKIEKTRYVYPTNEEIGIDLGIKTTATLSNGKEYNVPDHKEIDNKIKRAQRARKKKQTRKLHRKKKNIKLDWLHKTTLDIASQYPTINVGDVKSNSIIKKAKKDKNKSLTRGVADASWYTFKLLLQYKAEKLGGIFKLVPEQYTTKTCSNCLSRSGPSGKGGLGVREWVCKKCASRHLRDVNAAKNILRIGHNTPCKGTPRLIFRRGRMSDSSCCLSY